MEENIIILFFKKYFREVLIVLGVLIILFQGYLTIQRSILEKYDSIAESDTYENCIDAAFKEYENNWDSHCLEMGREKDCRLPNSISTKLSDQHDSDLNICKAKFPIKKFYTKSVSNVRECASLDCKIIGQFPINAEFQFRYQEMEKIPEWVELTYLNEQGKEITSYINKIVLSEGPVVVVERVIERPALILKDDNTKRDLNVIIKEWRKLIAYIECEWRYQDGSLFARGSGSGFLFPASKDGSLFVLTNSHVLLYEKKYTPRYCTVQIPDDPSIISLSFDKNEILPSRKEDIGYLKITNPTSYIKNNIISTDISGPSPFCNIKPELGDRVIILGYPSIGSSSDITVTEGIISGYDGNYFITSAKVESGNSGGAAILIKDDYDCYLGIPTFAISGSIESLARILDINYVLPNIGSNQ